MSALPGANLGPIFITDDVVLSVNVSLNHESQPAVYLHFTGDADFEAVKAGLMSDPFFNGFRISAQSGSLFVPVEPACQEYLGLILQKTCARGAWELHNETLVEIVLFASENVRAAHRVLARTQSLAPALS